MSDEHPNWQNWTYDYKNDLSVEDMKEKFRKCKNYQEFVAAQNATKLPPVIECSPALRKEIEEMLNEQVHPRGT